MSQQGLVSVTGLNKVSLFLQCYDLSTGVLSEINSFRASFLAKKIHKKRINTSIAHTNHFKHC